MSVRIGKAPLGRKPKLLLVKLKRNSPNSLKKRQQIVKGAPVLRTSSDDEIQKNIYINPDLTRTQIQKRAEFRRNKDERAAQSSGGSHCSQTA